MSLVITFHILMYDLETSGLLQDDSAPPPIYRTLGLTE